MDKDKIFINYIREEYLLYTKKNFETIIDNTFSYGTRLNEYNFDISAKANNILNKLKELFINKQIKYSYKEFKKNIRINIIFNSKNYPTTPAKVVLPVFVENSLRVILIATNFIIDNKIDCNYKISKVNNYELLVLNIFDYKDAEKFIKFYSSDDELTKEIQNKISPIVPSIYGIGLYTDIKPYNYINSFNNFLCLYFKTIKKIDKIDFESLLDFLEDYYKKETRLLKKEMIMIIIKSIKVIKDRSNIYDIFEYNADMNIGSFDHSDYNLRLDEDKLLYFENKEKTVLILFGTEEYMNLSYSKFYKNVAEKTSNELYYTYFKNIYYKLLENKYKGLDELLDFSSFNSDIIYQQLILISSAYFACKKLNFDIDLIYSILKKVLEKKLNCEIDYQEKEIGEIKKNTVVFPFSIEYGNKVLYLKDGNLTTVFNYFRENYILDKIPLDAVLNLKDGTTIKGEDYLKKLDEIIPNYISFSELFSKEIDFIEFAD